MVNCIEFFSNVMLLKVMKCLALFCPILGKARHATSLSEISCVALASVQNKAEVSCLNVEMKNKNFNISPLYVG